MPIVKYFDQIPPFSSEVQTVPLPKVSLKELQNGSGKEKQLLFQACQEWGFFSLDLQGSTKGDELLQTAEQMFELTKETFDLGQSVLDNYAYKPPTSLTG
jgi:isopenicillin N synthase-like dioxygenase